MNFECGVPLLRSTMNRALVIFFYDLNVVFLERNPGN